MECLVRRLGLIDYAEAWKLQDSLAAQIAAGQRPATLLLLEHPHTYTFGRRGHIENLLWDESELERRGIAIYWVDRGGDVTYHGPGQLVGYPLLPLGTAGLMPVNSENAHLPQADYVGYVRRLERALILALDRMGVPAVQLEGLTGVWIPARTPGQSPAKIAAIGVKVDVHGVTRHGFALNVNPDMEYWQGIIGCGLKEHAITSLVEQLPEKPEMEVVIGQVISAFGEVFNFQMRMDTG